MASGTVVAQLITFVLMPIVTRLYDPSALGLLAMFSSVLSIFLSISTLRMDSAILLPESKKATIDLVYLCLVILSLFCLVLYLPLYFFSAPLFEFFNAEGLIKYAWILPIGIFVSGFYAILFKLSVREKQFHKIAQTRILQSIVSPLIQIGFYRIGVLALISGQVFNQSAGIFNLLSNLLKRFKLHKIKKYRLKRVGLRYSKFAKFEAPAGIINVFGTSLPIFIFTSLFGSSATGLYYLCSRVLSIPSEFIGEAVSQVMLSSAAKAKREGFLGELLFDVMRVLAHSIIPVVAFILVFGDLIFAVLFGDNWLDAGRYAQILVFLVFFQFITAPITVLVGIIEKQGHNLFFQSFLLIGRVLGFSSALFIKEVFFVLKIYVVMSLSCYLIYLIWISYACGNSVGKTIKKILVYIFWLFFLTALLFTARSFSIQSSIPFYILYFIISAYIYVKLFNFIKSDGISMNRNRKVNDGV